MGRTTIFITRLYCAVFSACLLASTTTLAQDLDRFDKLQSVLKYLGIPEERSYYDDLKLWDGQQTRQGFDTIRKYVDPSDVLSRYARWDDNRLVIFQDRDTRKVVDFSLEFKPSGPPSDPKGLIASLRRKGPLLTDKPLDGFRIALDPGHMGGSFWDQKTGKFLKINSSGLISEGEIALHACLLLARDLRQLGAEVLITRTSLQPVSDLPHETFDLTAFAQHKIKISTDLKWFDQLLKRIPVIGSNPFQPIDESRELRRLQSEDMRYPYFISIADLAARADKINTFKPQMTVVLHFDAFETVRLQHRKNWVRAYVPGNLQPHELATREQRFLAMRTLFDGHRWVESNVFTASIVKNLSIATKVALKTDPTDFGAIKIADGVYARNLALNRLVSEGVMAYVEALCYDYAPEFNRLKRKNRRAEIDGIPIHYSSRLEDVVDGIRQGILEYVASMEKRPVVRL